MKTQIPAEVVMQKLFEHPEVAAGMAALGFKITQTSKSFTLQIKKESPSWEVFVRQCAIAVNKKGSKKQLEALMKLGKGKK